MRRSSHSVNTAAIPYESRLVRVLRAREERRELIEQAEAIGRLTGVSTGEAIKVTLTMKAEPGDLRGIPVMAKGVGGTQPGTRPDGFIDRVA
jgi:hypothetical protein